MGSKWASIRTGKVRKNTRKNVKATAKMKTSTMKMEKGTKEKVRIARK